MSNTRRTRLPAGLTEKEAKASEQQNNVTEASDTAAGATGDEAGGAPAEEAGGGSRRRKPAAPPEDRTVEFMGEQFRLSDTIGSYPMLMFQRYVNTADPRGMTALHMILEDAIHPDDWQRFEDAAITGKADDEDFAAVLTAAAETLSLQVARREQAARRAPQDHQPPRRQPGRPR